nr:replication associated protein [Flumine microvirus 16]
MVRYFMCGEYGSDNGRPHYHALLFNLGFQDRVYLRTSPSGEKLYRSPTLEMLWPFGFSAIGDVTFGSAAYVARYAVKKQGGVVARDHYLDKRTGEMLAPEYVAMSRGSSVRGTGGLARGWFSKFKSDVFPHDIRVIKGVDTLPCKFYDKLYEVADPEGFRLVKLRRALRGSINRADNTEERLKVKELVKTRQVALLSTSKEI